MSRTRALLLLLIPLSVSQADGPTDNIAENVRRVPRLGIEVTAQQRTKLETGLANLQTKIAALRERSETHIASLIPDVVIFYRAVHDALKHQEFFNAREIAAAEQLLSQGADRADALLRGEAPWTDERGLVVRGYTSKIDGSVQPYGLVIPQSYTHQTARKYRVDIWFHGRGETLSEVSFLNQRQRQVGQFAPADAIVLHSYGRYSNAFKFAGEVDVLEGLESVRSRYRVDENRTSVRGFSMGGAACWQFAVHYSDRWFAANPGAGFSETPRFLDFFQKETLNPTWYEKKLWRMYDCNLWAKNLLHCPTVAYSGELDIQKQAADVMEEALATHDIKLVHIIGPQTKHSYHPDSKVIVENRLDSLAAKGRKQMPQKVSLTTYTLKYNRMHWLTIDGLGEHWEAANVEAHVTTQPRINITTKNVTDLSIDFPSGWFPFSPASNVGIVIDDQTVTREGKPLSDRSLHVKLHRDGNQWRLGARTTDQLRKRHDLQGPVDDAFMDSFIFVKPTGKAANEKISAWADAELERAIVHWRRHFRGDARVKKDSEVTEQDIANSNLILWGDFQSNAFLAKVADRLPILWQATGIRVDQKTFAADNHALIAIYPNPLNPKRYVVLNSSFTFREFAYLNNARQVSKLPDWAVINVDTAPNSLWPGEVVEANFFDENWQLKAADAR
ncbi:MAG: dienelactone hydrolase [Pirellulaceae bacterium]|jgi:dienelactone hydrolase